MEPSPVNGDAGRRAAVAWLKMGLLVAFAAGAILAYRHTGIGRYLTKETVREFVHPFGALGPVVHILLYAVAVTCFVPATLMTIAGAVAFGKVAGAVYNIVGATLGSVLSFLVARYLGRDLAARLVKGRLKELDGAAERNGFAVVLYLRLAYCPFTPLNFGAGLTGIRLRDFLWGTVLGIIPGTFIYTAFVDEVTNLSSVGDLFTVRFLVPLAVFLTSFLIPVVVKKIANRWQASGAV